MISEEEARTIRATWNDKIAELNADRSTAAERLAAYLVNRPEEERQPAGFYHESLYDVVDHYLHDEVLVPARDQAVRVARTNPSVVFDSEAYMREFAEDWGQDEYPDDRAGRKRDRLARLLRVASILYSAGSGDQGVPVTEIARLTGMTTRTV